MTRVYSLATFDDGSGPALYAGGDFNSAGGVATAHIARWDGSGWSSPAGGFGVPADIPRVLSLAVFDDGSGPALYAGGRFTIAGGVPALNIAEWSGSTWSPLGPPQPHALNGVVNALTLFDDGLGGGTALYATGSFSTAGGVPVNGIARWDGASWSPLGSGIAYGGLALAAFDDGNGDELYVAGAGVSPNISKWNGTSWSGVGNGINLRVSALAVYDEGGGPALFAGGFFTGAGGNPAARVARWNGTSWSGVGGGTNAEVRALAVFDGGGGPELIVAGEFTFAGGSPANRIAKWNGSSWSPLGSGMNDDVLALTVHDDGGGPELYAGGSFTSAGGIDASYVAKWDGSAWSALSGMSDEVRALGVFDDGSGAALYAGGDFTFAGGVPANRIARWDGSSWSPLGSGMNTGSVVAFEVFDDGSGAGPALFAGGSFVSSPAGDARLAKWGCPPAAPLHHVLHGEDGLGLRARQHQCKRCTQRHGLERLHHQGPARARMPGGAIALLEPVDGRGCALRRPRRRRAVPGGLGAEARRSDPDRRLAQLLRGDLRDRHEPLPGFQLDGGRLQSPAGSEQPRRLSREHRHHRQRPDVGTGLGRHGAGAERRDPLDHRAVIRPRGGRRRGVVLLPARPW